MTIATTLSMSNIPSLSLVFLPLIISLCFLVGGFYILRGNAFWTALWSNVRWEQVLSAWGITIEQIRSVSIEQLLCFEMFIVSSLTFAQFSLLLPDLTVPAYISVIQFLGWLLAVGFQLGGIMLNVCRGQLGGSVSGWWWRTKGSVA